MYTKILTISIALVWIANGLVCKVLNLVPRHQEIVGSILGTHYARPLTMAIGISEIIMGIWVLSRYQSKVNAIIQICVIMIMNILEFTLVPELLLWGRFNILFAITFSILIAYKEFFIHEKSR